MKNSQVAVDSPIFDYVFGEVLHSSDKTDVYQGIQKESQHSVVIKVLSLDYPSVGDLVQFRNQYAITRHLNHPGITTPLALERYGNGYALVMPDEGFIALPFYWKQYERKGAETVEAALKIALQLADVLHYLTAQRILHKDIKPANILIHPETQQVQLIDFSIASFLLREQQELANPNVLEGTLAYLSPEQTGRMNRGIDYRSDFYALGVTLYELLTGMLPFPTDDPMALVHHHITTQPPIAHVLNPDVPSVLSDIIVKLMAKNAEDRYQSALGLKYDLKRCRDVWMRAGVEDWFVLGEKDVSDRFLIPEKLYGRHKEIGTLLEAFNRASTGHPELMLVAGFSGIGKTAVVNEIHKPITHQNGYFIKGKFDQFNRNIPLSGFVQAFRGFTRQLLGESDAALKQWRVKILQAVGKNGQVILEVIPELEHIIGPQPVVSELSGSAAQNRFNLVFGQFVQVFTIQDHPLVIFLDDLQWADSASLNLLKLLMASSTLSAKTGYLLVLGAYRDNEVFPAHPLMAVLDDIEKQGAAICTLPLTSLSKTDVNQLVADTLLCSRDIAAPLTQLVFQKTAGNPFFVTQFLQGLHQDGYIFFNWDASCWQYDMAQIRLTVQKNDVVEFMVGRLQTLSSNTQEMLKLAACIGNRFDLETLAMVSDRPQEFVAENLWQGLQLGLVVPENQTYKFFQGTDYYSDYHPYDFDDHFELPKTVTIEYRFLHDRVQQAAYTLIPKEQRAPTHWQIGQLLLEKLPSEKADNQIFEIVNQLNWGRLTVVDSAKRRHLAQLNLRAGQQAKLSAAYQSAQAYCAVGIDLLAEQGWVQDYRLVYQLYYAGSEAAYLCGDFKQAEQWYSIALHHAQTPLDKATIHRVQMTQYQLQGRNREAIAIQRQSLQLLGWDVPDTEAAIQSSLERQIAKVQQFLGQYSITTILEHPKMDAVDIAESLRILQVLFYASWLDGQSTLALLALAKMTTLSLEHGNSDMSPFGYVGYGMIANVRLKDAALAYDFGRLSVELCEQFDNADVRGMTNFLFAADVHSWSRPLQEADVYYDNAYRYGMDAGNWLTVSFMMMLSGSDRLTYGRDLDDLHNIVQVHADFLLRVKSLENRDALIAGVLQPVRHLLGLTNHAFTFDDEQFSEADYIEQYRDTPYHLAWLYSVKIRHAYLLQQRDCYADLIPKLRIIEETVPTHAKVPSSVFYVALMQLTLAETTPNEAEARCHWLALEQLEQQLQQWLGDCPANIQHKYLLIQAEKARLNQQNATAMETYDQAIAEAKAQGYSYEEALANELAAKFYLCWGREKVAVVYMQEAYYCYARWGATIKTDDLEQRYPHLLKAILRSLSPSINLLDGLATFASPHQLVYSTQPISTSPITSLNTALDFVSVLKVSQAISDIIDLDELLQRLTHIILENSGGDRCALILPNNGTWDVRAIATTETTSLHIEPLEHHPELPVQLIQYVKNTQEVVTLERLSTDVPIVDDYINRKKTKSVLCLPLINQGTLVGILYLQNQLIRGVFTSDRLIILNFLCAQAAISLDKARLHAQEREKARILDQAHQRLQLLIQQTPVVVIEWNTDAECQSWNPAAEKVFGYKAAEMLGQPFSCIIPTEYHTFIDEVVQQILSEQGGMHTVNENITKDGQRIVCEWFNAPMLDLSGNICGGVSMALDITARTKAEAATKQKSQELEAALTDLEHAQLQVIQSEKMSALGNLVAGVAHEINNPLGFVSGNIDELKLAVNDIVQCLQAYRDQEAAPNSDIQKQLEDAEIDFVLEDIPKILNSMKTGCDRIQGISTSLRIFSRTDAESMIKANVHEGLDSTLLILKYRLKAKDFRPEIRVIRHYSELPDINCFPGQLNQVFMNILANAIDMFDEMADGCSYDELEANPQQITIQTQLVDNKGIKISISDNGKGMSEAICGQVFDRRFTTKAVGKGTGLGLAIAHQVITQKHGGVIEVESRLGQGTTFSIALPMERQDHLSVIAVE